MVLFSSVNSVASVGLSIQNHHTMNAINPNPKILMNIIINSLYIVHLFC
ncbi:protein of unknown function [Moritella yayanosii]|uniref:Uncharacterized protein n=1 Tax=Moritella yayanosii TaxID=69539 RepID=A0A330LRB4_9GAMM|nr:protein of unknown function [Moritella yayanosii]